MTPPLASVDAASLAAGGEVSLEVRVVNHSDRPATQVVQCYVAAPAGPVLRPLRSLQAFEKVHLEPLGATTVVLRLGGRAFAHWDPGDAYRSPLEPTPEGRLGTVERTTAGSWAVPTGRYRIEVATSSDAIEATALVELT